MRLWRELRKAERLTTPCQRLTQLHDLPLLSGDRDPHHRRTLEVAGLLDEAVGLATARGAGAEAAELAEHTGGADDDRRQREQVICLKRLQRSPPRIRAARPDPLTSEKAPGALCARCRPPGRYLEGLVPRLWALSRVAAVRIRSRPGRAGSRRALLDPRSSPGTNMPRRRRFGAWCRAGSCRIGSSVGGPTTVAVLNEADGPNPVADQLVRPPRRSRRGGDALAPSRRGSRPAPGLSGSSATPTTAHSATSGCEARTSSIAPVESLWPATLMMSSVRDMTKT